MSSGFSTLKDILDVVVIPVVLALLALLWPSVQAWHRRRVFERLILRELEEAGPYPDSRQPGKNWKHHHTKTFVHQKVFADPSENRDFILSLDPELAYFVSQLWDAHRTGDAGQWLWYLSRISERYPANVRLRGVHKRWKELITGYSGVAV